MTLGLRLWVRGRKKSLSDQPRCENQHLGGYGGVGRGGSRSLAIENVLGKSVTAKYSYWHGIAGVGEDPMHTR